MQYPDMPEQYYCELCTHAHVQEDELYPLHGTFARGSLREPMVQRFGEADLETQPPAEADKIIITSPEARTLEVVAAIFDKMIRDEELIVIVGWKGFLLEFDRTEAYRFNIVVTDPTPGHGKP